MCAEDNQIDSFDKVSNIVKSMHKRTRENKIRTDSSSEQTFDEIYSCLSKEEIFLEYLNFMRTFPDVLDTEKTKLLKLVKDELCIDKIVQEIKCFDFDSLLNKHKSSYLIEHLSTKLGFSLNILCPPVKSCMLCENKLTLNNKPTQVVVHTVTGP